MRFKDFCLFFFCSLLPSLSYVRLLIEITIWLSSRCFSPVIFFAVNIFFKRQNPQEGCPGERGLVAAVMMSCAVDLPFLWCDVMGREWHSPLWPCYLCTSVLGAVCLWITLFCHWSTHTRESNSALAPNELTVALASVPALFLECIGHQTSRWSCLLNSDYDIL